MGYIEYLCRSFAIIKNRNSQVIAYGFFMMNGSHWELVPQNLIHKDAIFRALDNYAKKY